MNNWNTDAGNISDESSFDNALLLKTYPIEDFLNTQRDNLFFIIGPKGFGKTFVLKAKSILYRRDRIPIIHDDILVDKPGSASYIFSQDKLSLFSSLQSWTNLWTASIILAVLKKFNVLSSANGPSSLIEKLSSCPATTITSYCKTILALSRSDFFVLVEDLNKFLIPAMERINSPIAAFIDNVDEYFDVHIDTKQDQQSVSGQTSKDIWYLSQIGLVESIYQITSKNRHLKLFVAIRKEAFKRIPMYDSKSIQYEGNCIDLTYSPEDFREMLCLNIKREAKERLCFPDSLEKDPLYAFFGISIVAQSYIQDENEDIFQYIMRHTLQRPRDFMHIGRQVKYMRPKERTPNALKLKINEAASEIARSYLKEVSPHIGDITFEKLFTLIDTNILSCNDVKRICSLYNSIECSASECKTCSGQHIFCTLYSIGLLGYAKKDQVTDDIYQEFLSPGVKSFDIPGNLPSADYFLIHPCLYGLISDINQNFKPDRTNIVGPNRSLINYLKWHGFKAERSEKKIYSFPKIEGQRCHVHFGAGKLGWGLVIPLFKDMGRVVVFQRPSERWNDFKNCEKVSLFNGEHNVVTFNVIHELADNINPQTTLDKWLSNEHLFVITSNKDLIAAIIEQADSISTAVDKGLKDITNILLHCRFNRKINLFPFENDVIAVESLGKYLSSTQPFIEVIPVVADRICSHLTIKKNQVHITTEEYSEVTILGKNKTVVNLFKNSNNIRVTKSMAEQQFYFNRKSYIVNGIHMIMAIYGYSYLLNKKIPLNDWGTYHISVISDIKNLRNKMELFIAIQSMRLLLKTDSAILEKLFSKKPVQDIYNVLISYGKMSLSRIESTIDKIMRVLDLNDIRKLEGKFKQRIEEMIDFVTDDLSSVAQLKLSDLPSDANIYNAVIELQKMSNDLFLKLIGSIQDK